MKSNTKSVVLNRFKHLLQLKYTGKTPDIYIGYVSDFLDFSKNVPDRINNEDILDYNIHVKDWGYSARNGAISAIKQYFYLYLRKEPKGFSTIRPKKQKTITKVYNAEITAIKINNVINLKHRAILALGLSSWLRRSEVVNLKITDINSERMRIYIKQSKGAKDREVKLSEKTLLILRKYVAEYKPVEYLFNGQSSIKYSASSVNAICKNHLGFRFHSLRASGATHALKMGVDVKTVSEMLGHASIETTKHYLPILFDTVKQAI